METSEAEEYAAAYALFEHQLGNVCGDVSMWPTWTAGVSLTSTVRRCRVRLDAMLAEPHCLRSAAVCAFQQGWRISVVCNFSILHTTLMRQLCMACLAASAAGKHATLHTTLMVSHLLLVPCRLRCSALRLAVRISPETSQPAACSSCSSSCEAAAHECTPDGSRPAQCPHVLSVV